MAFRFPWEKARSLWDSANRSHSGNQKNPDSELPGVQRPNVDLGAGTSSERYEAWREFVGANKDETIPHCDSRILHHPLECAYCDRRAWQAERLRLRIAFTGHEPTDGEVRCPADTERPADGPSDHRRWGGNKPTSAQGDATWPEETFASQVMYGDLGGRN